MSLSLFVPVGPKEAEKEGRRERKREREGGEERKTSGARETRNSR